MLRIKKKKKKKPRAAFDYTRLNNNSIKRYDHYCKKKKKKIIPICLKIRLRSTAFHFAIHPFSITYKVGLHLDIRGIHLQI